MLEQGDLSEKARIRNEMADLRKDKTQKYNEWKQLCSVNEICWDEVNSDWNKSLKSDNEIQLKKAPTLDEGEKDKNLTSSTQKKRKVNETPKKLNWKQRKIMMIIQVMVLWTQ